MAINLCRFDPKSFVPYVRQAYKDHVLLKAGSGKKMNDLIAKLQATPSLKQVTFDEQASEAVRENNKAVIAKAEAKPTKGGNIAKYNEIKGGDNTSSCAEFTFPQFEGTTGQQFIALQLALDFEDFEGAEKDAAAKPAALDATAELADAPIPAQPATEAGSAPDKSTGSEVKTDAAAKDKPAKAAAAAGKPTKPSYSPILDDDVQFVGICNKVHPKTVNLLQVLYVKAVSNALV
mmetsp:Transcript_22389/g.27539  ORF Transcript_22389/g.27539 Transcript_22389/m.27539 type:complete len:234 (-) Transcript_22389:99-800(-)|eukprot:CAMPEP_0170463928 /NCGR_PEP_ID=MMETSP0123-20130129/8849_1 /TAXON_ID=182087 /ORGANISM="Favella ehrenbergii, Strain Fehren 1" /LENGTH=233 /DNA_ID=CAMNT_0010729469 /DNA_START=149 /DNA_END=850 /DNA_ORIENTATION=+